MKIEAMTSTTATRAPPISSMALMVASRAESLNFVMLRSTFSTTTMASSTTMPMASTRPKSVSRLMEKPMTSMPAKAPISATKMATMQMIVERNFCRKR